MKFLTSWKSNGKDEANNMTENKYKLTIAELRQIEEYRDSKYQWATIRDNMFYTYEDGYSITLNALQQQYHQWRYAKDDPTNPKTGRWNAQEHGALIRLWNYGIPISIMCKVLNRTRVQIYNKTRRININRYGNIANKEDRFIAIDNLLKDNPSNESLLETAKRVMLVPNKEHTTPKQKSPFIPRRQNTLMGGYTHVEVKKEPVIHNSNLRIEQGNPMIMDGKEQIDNTEHSIVNQCQYICDLLLAKNKQYGDSVSQPVRIFSKADSSEQIKVRIDDKISRLVRGDDSLEPDEDIIDDLIGYLILLKIQMNK